MTAQKRIYAVYDSTQADQEVRLVRASHQARAVHHVVGPRFKAEVPTQDQLVALLTAGRKVEDVE